MKNLKNGSWKEKAKNWTTAKIHTVNVALKEIETKIPLITSELMHHEIQSSDKYQILVTDNRKFR